MEFYESGSSFQSSFSVQPSPSQTYSSSNDNEPPLLEELGIDVKAIMSHALWILNPLREVSLSVQENIDLAGPLLFCLCLGGFLLLAGKSHFGYIYGLVTSVLYKDCMFYCDRFGIVGAVCIYAILNLMSDGQFKDHNNTNNVMNKKL